MRIWWWSISLRICRGGGVSLAPTPTLNLIKHGQRTLRLKATISSSVIVSDLAMTGMRLTRACKRFMNSMSIGLSLANQSARGQLSRQPQSGADDARMPRRLEKVDARMHAIVHELGAVNAVLLLEKGVVPLLDVVDDRLPATAEGGAACQLPP